MISRTTRDLLGDPVVDGQDDVAERLHLGPERMVERGHEAVDVRRPVRAEIRALAMRLTVGSTRQPARVRNR
ncbi:hypothetical protein JNW88_13530 [Micromonospora sp. ATA32]|nr:hypothetical protein [Micromonospora sp. ATA32]